MNSPVNQALAVRQDFGGTSSTLAAQETASAYVAAQGAAATISRPANWLSAAISSSE